MGASGEVGRTRFPKHINTYQHVNETRSAD